MDERTIFHKIRDKEIPADIVYEDDDVLAFRDVKPRAATHILFIPKHFVRSINHITPHTAHIPGLLILKAQQFAKKNNLHGYKLTFHVEESGGQEVFYLHLNFLSPHAMKEGA